MTTEFAQIIGPLAKQLLGEPNRALSSAVELRYGAHGSLSVDLAKGTWFDHEANEGGGVLDLVTRETKLQGSERLDWLKQQGLLAGRASSDQPGRGTGPDRQQQVAWYDYTDQDGSLIFQVVRYEPKDFRQRRKPRPNDPPEDVKGGWVWNVKDVKPVPYHLPQLLENDDRVVCIVEGEKSADKLLKISIPATCSAGGAGKWRNELNEYFRGADVVILPDYDPQKTHPKTGEPMVHAKDGRPVLPGQDHAQAVAAALYGIAARIRVLELWTSWPEMPLKGDVSDWIANGGTAEALYALIDRTPEWSPSHEKTASGPDKPSDAPSADDGELGEWDAGDDDQTPPPRGWLLGTSFCRGFASSLLGDGGVGKTALRYAQVLSLATGRVLVGEYVFQRCRVLIVSLEDGPDELRRRVRAAYLHHGIQRGDVKGWLYLAALGRAAGKLMTLDQHNRPVLGALAAKLARTIAARKIDLVILDPFIKSHGIAENDNSGIDEVAQILTNMADTFNIAVDVPHHMAKGPADPGNANRGRGASSLKDALRLVRTATIMTTEEAKAFGLDEVERRRLIRVDDAKLNIRATTKNLVSSVEIRIRDNGTGIPAEVREKMFNPFFTTKPAGEGTGLGLSMTHDIIVKQHGGRIDVATEPGQFTEFTIVLPRKSNSSGGVRGAT